MLTSSATGELVPAVIIVYWQGLIGLYHDLAAMLKRLHLPCLSIILLVLTSLNFNYSARKKLKCLLITCRVSADSKLAIIENWHRKVMSEC